MTPARKEVVDFANPYMKVALGVVSKDGSVIADLEQLKGKTLIVDKGTTADIFFTKNYPDVKLLKFEQNTETFEALRAPAVRKDAPELLNWLNNEIQTLGKDGRLKQAYEKTLLPVYGDTVSESDIVVEYK